MAPDPSRIGDRYDVLRVLGEGAMGRVLLARDGLTAEEVALKVILGAAAEKTAMQFRQEFRLMTGLRHPNCCQVQDYGVDADQQPFFTMELVPGQGLDEAGTLDEARFRTLFPPLLLALGYIHRQGLVHLDLKPANVRVKPDGTVKLMDYGLMAYAGEGGGAIRGTLPYVSPEMARRAPIDRRADLYAAGCLAYELLSGQPPFVRRSAVELLRAHAEERPEPLARQVPGLSPDLAQLIMRLLAKEPVERPQSAEEVLEALGYEAPAGIGGSLLASPMVGRDVELAILADALKAVMAGGPGRVIAVAGAPGVGKTRLLDAFRVAVQLAPAPYAAGAAREHQRLPYAALVEALRALLPALRRHVPGPLAEAAPFLVRLLPELGVEPAPALEVPKHEMLRLQAALGELLRALAHVQPFVLVLENLQWADVPTHAFVAAMRRNLGDAPALLVTTEQGAAEAEITLAGLPEAEIGRMAAHMLGAEAVPAAFAAAVAARTARNPLHLERLLEHLVKAGTLARRAGRWNMELDLATLRLPAGLDALLDAKLTALSAEALFVARALAVAGRPGGLALLQAMTGLPEPVLFDALAALRREQLVVTDPAGDPGLAQQHDLDAIYAGIAEDARTALHARAADALLEMAGTHPLSALPTELVTALALHALQGGRHDAAIRANVEAGRRASALFGLADAESFLSAALTLLDAGLGPGLDRERADALRLMGDVKRFSGFAAEAVAHLQDAVALGGSGLGRLLTTLAKAHQMGGAYAEAEDACTRSVAACEAEGDPAGAARALVTLGRLHFFQGRLAPAKDAAGRALALARAGGDRGITGLTLALLGFLYVASEPEKLAEGVARLDEAVALLTEVGDRAALNDAYNLLGNAGLMLGELPRARTAFEATAAISRECGLGEEVSVALVSLATVDVERGRYAQARAGAAEARRLAEGLGARFPLGMALVLEGVAAAHLGEPAAADDLTAAALATARELGNAYLESVVLPRRIAALLALGRAEDALAACDTLAALLAAAGNAELEGVLHGLRALALVAAGRADEATTEVAKAWAPARRMDAKAVLALAGLAQARAAAGHEAWEEAEAAGSEALALATRIGADGIAAELRAVLGEVALAVGGPGAAAHFEALEALAAATGAREWGAIARFGRAAAAPYERQAAELAAGARGALEAIAADLSPEARAAYLATPERRRVVEGNFVGFGLPRRRAPAGPRFGLGFGGLPG